MATVISLLLTSTGFWNFLELLRAKVGLGTGRSCSSSSSASSATAFDSGEMWNSWKDLRQLVVIELTNFRLGFGNGSLGVSLTAASLDCTFKLVVVNALDKLFFELFKLFGVSIGLGFSSGGFWNEESNDFPPFILVEDRVFISNRCDGCDVVGVSSNPFTELVACPFAGVSSIALLTTVSSVVTFFEALQGGQLVTEGFLSLVAKASLLKARLRLLLYAELPTGALALLLDIPSAALEVWPPPPPSSESESSDPVCRLVR